jgi:hypothetical protein
MIITQSTRFLLNVRVKHVVHVGKCIWFVKERVMDARTKLEAKIPSTFIVARKLAARARSPHVHFAVGWAKGVPMDPRKRLVASEAVRHPRMMKIQI